MYWMFFLIAARFFGAMSICPLFGATITSQALKVILSGLFALIVFPMYMHTHLGYDRVIFAILLAKEVVVGAVIGFILGLPIWLVENVGNLIDIQRGEQFGATINPMTQDPASSIAKLLNQGFMVYLVTAGGFGIFVEVMCMSFVNWPPQSYFFGPAAYQVMFHAFSAYFYWMVILALPALLVMYLLDLILSLFSSFVPQLNVTILAMPIKSVFALFVVILYIGQLYHFAITRFMNEELVTLFQV